MTVRHASNALFREELERLEPCDRITVVPTTQIIDMDESPVDALRRKRITTGEDTGSEDTGREHPKWPQFDPARQAPDSLVGPARFSRHPPRPQAGARAAA